MSLILELLDNIPPAMYKELFDLQDIPQDQIRHPEGDAFQHTILVFDAAEKIAKRENLNEQDTMILLNAALTHDLGKVSTTELHADGRITAYGHDEASVPLAYDMLSRLGVTDVILDHVVRLVRFHMAHIAFNPVTQRAVKRLAKKLYPSNIYMRSLLVEADHCGRTPLECRLPPKAREVFLRAQVLGIENGDLSSLQ